MVAFYGLVNISVIEWINGAELSAVLPAISKFFTALFLHTARRKQEW